MMVSVVAMEVAVVGDGGCQYSKIYLILLVMAVATIMEIISVMISCVHFPCRLRILWRLTDQICVLCAKCATQYCRHILSNR